MTPEAIALYGVSQGLITVRPQPAKSLASRVASPASTTQRRRGNLGVEGLDRAAFAAAGGDNLRVMDGGSLLEGQHAAREIVGEHRRGRGREREAAPPFGKHGDAVEDFGLADTGGVERGARLGGNPREHRRGGFRAHQFGEDVGVEDDHRSNRGGSRTGTGRCGSSSSAPPSGRKRRRMASARFGSARFSPPSASFKDVAKLGFHRPAVAGGAHTQLFLQRGVNVADGKGRHPGFRSVPHHMPTSYAMHALNSSGDGHRLRVIG